MILMFVFQNNNISCDIHNQDNILDISSGLLHLTGEFFIPDSINKSCLEDAKVLQQVDKKFIPVVAGGTLAVIDQVHPICLLFFIYFVLAWNFCFSIIIINTIRYHTCCDNKISMNMICYLPSSGNHKILPKGSDGHLIFGNSVWHVMSCTIKTRTLKELLKVIVTYI